MSPLPRLVPPWVRYANWAYKAGDFAADYFTSAFVAPTLYTCRIEMWTDSLLPRDSMECVVYFTGDATEEAGPLTGTTAMNVAGDVGALFRDAWGPSAGQIRTSVWLRDTESSSSELGAPDATWIDLEGQTRTSPCPREVALCLSYFAGRNEPGRRGRIFLPVAYTDTVPGARPTAPLMERARALAEDLADVGDTFTKWCLYSRTQDAAFTISDSWVDNEWDTQRSRGLDPTGRVSTQHPDA